MKICHMNFFKKLLSYGEEFVLYYQDRKFYISQRKDLGELYLTASEENYHIFYSPKELLSAPLIDGETLLERWMILQFIKSIPKVDHLIQVIT